MITNRKTKMNGPPLPPEFPECLPADPAAADLFIAKARGFAAYLEKYKKNINTRLRLSESLTSFPDIQCACQLLDLRANFLTALPSSVWSWPNLQTLDLSGNSLQVLPDPVSSLTSLENLDFFQSYDAISPFQPIIS